jgi:hypothetical protein
MTPEERKNIIGSFIRTSTVSELKDFAGFVNYARSVDTECTFEQNATETYLAILEWLNTYDADKKHPLPGDALAGVVEQVAPPGGAGRILPFKRRTA